MGNFIRRSKSRHAVVGVMLALATLFFSNAWAAPSRYRATVLPQLDSVDTVDSPARTVGKALSDQGEVVGEFGFPPQSFSWPSGASALSAKEQFRSGQAFFHDVSDDTRVGSFLVPGEAPRAFSIGKDKELKLLPKLSEGSRLAATATAVSRNGVIAGWCETNSPEDAFNVARHAVIWRNGAINDLGQLGGNDSEAVAVNNFGMVAGSALERSGQPTRAFRWSESRGLEGLPALAEGAATAAFDLNDAGSIVGFAESIDSERGAVRHAASWSPENQLSVLPFVPFAQARSASAEALALNHQGQIVGLQRNVGKIQIQAVLWEDGMGYALQDLVDNLPGGIRFDSAVAINDRGEILVNGFNEETTQYITVLLIPIIPAPTGAAPSDRQREGRSAKAEESK